MPRRPRQPFSTARFLCDICQKACLSTSGLTRHRNSHPSLPAASRQPSATNRQSPALQLADDPLPFPPPSLPPNSPPNSPPPDSPPPSEEPPAHARVRIERHPLLDGELFSCTPCDADGYDLPAGAPPPPLDERAKDDWGSFDTREQFEFAEFIFKRQEMSGDSIDQLAQFLAALYKDDDPFFNNHRDLYAMIDEIQEGDIPWQSFSVQYTGPRPDSGQVPPWMTQTYEVWFRSPLAIFERQLANPDFKDELDWAPKRVFKEDKRQFTDLMSGNWAWRQADIIARDENTHGAMFVPIVTGSEADVRGSTRQYASSNEFRKFRRQLFHSSIRRVFESVRPHMTTPRVTRCADRHFRRAIYGFGPDIADYPEQALLTGIVQGYCPICLSPADDLDRDSPMRSCEHTAALLETLTLKEMWDNYGVVGDIIPFTADFPRADIHELISVDLLHQIIKGTFKDHIVDWIELYIKQVNEPAEAERILADIDRRIAVAPPFPGLRRFPVGRGFKQWTGNDSKGLMKVYLPAIIGHVPSEMVQAVAALIEFCYLVRRSVIDEDTLQIIDETIRRYHHYREAFRVVRPQGFSLPRQHALKHYIARIMDFGVPNGLCSSITESKHIRAVKRPYRRSNRNKPLGQMLLSNQRLDKLAAARADFTARGMLSGSLFASPLAPVEEEPQPVETTVDDDVEEGDVPGPTCLGEVTLAKSCGTVFLPSSIISYKASLVRKVPRDVHQLARYVRQPRLHELIRCFLFEQLNPERAATEDIIPLDDCPDFAERVYIYTSARAVFYAPSDICGIGGMRHERIRATKSWYRGPPRYDCALIEHDTEAQGFRGLHAVRVRLLMKFTYRGIQYPCALVHWFSAHGDAPCLDTGMWIVKPDWVRGSARTQPLLAVVHLDAILRGVHLIGVAGKDFLPPDDKDLSFSDSLDAFEAFYVNKYADYHAHEILF
ncbi:hypothetical protein MIND_00934900 [Mycena indigotica]|uniref:C2H2-type domain-containing protein n=1 Tax=Mycena indigotica TaxID=2126181 RepID=A0A8H6W2J5_9AGAR|nr:uncharacterized protein MIND_00934900 [Mycena indigotica]KAF7297024.1 hypothetical protein MIND_00934900 [Mycena indigotica]